MLISCPKCSAVYQVAAEKISSEGKRFKCAECGHVWTVYPEDLQNIEPEDGKIKSQKIAPEEAPDVAMKDLQEMFKRLSRDTDALFDDIDTSEVKAKPILNEEPAPQVIEEAEEEPEAKPAAIPVVTVAPSAPKVDLAQKMKRTFAPLLLNGLLMIFVVVAGLYIFYLHRYDVVKMVPELENLYQDANIESVYAGKDLVFENLETRHIYRHGKHYVEISGQISNKGQYRTQLLPIKATMVDAAGHVIAQETQVLTMDALEPEYSAMFVILLENTSPEQKNITLALEPNYTE